MDLTSLLNFALLAIGFGFVIFWHELGHFAAAKWAKVRVEQFAVGFGHAIVSWRKGLGFRRGTSAPEYEKLREAAPDRARHISPTEYRLNWLPLGGYVKMLGQEDLVLPEGGHEPDSYQNKSVGQRMVIISAGVVMNVILAAVLFTVLYFVGFSATAPKIGGVMPASPAERAGLQVGDTVVSINDSPTHDFGKLRLGVALLSPGEPADFLVQPAGTNDPSERRLVQVTPDTEAGIAGMLGIGVAPTPTLAVPSKLQMGNLDEVRPLVTDEALKVLPGERVTRVEGTPVEADDWHVLWRALQRAGNQGRPVSVQVEGIDGTERRERLTPALAADASTVFAGLRPLLRVESIDPASRMAPGGKREEAGLDVLRPGDTILRVIVPATNDAIDRPTIETLSPFLDAAGRAGHPIDIVVRRDGEEVRLKQLPLTPLGGGWLSRLLGNVPYGMYAGLAPDMRKAEVASSVTADTPAERAGIGPLLNDLVAGGARIVTVDGRPVESWYDVSRELRNATAKPAPPTQPATSPTTRATTNVTLTLELAGPAGSRQETVALPLDAEAGEAVRAVQWNTGVVTLQPTEVTSLQTLRQTRNPLQATWWGLFETRDQIVNLYLTLKRVTVDQTVSARNLSGPVGILHFGTIVSERGLDWLIWFLAMLSANLAVVNFLPIPILDGGHMVFLIWEKITGRPPSRKVQEGALWIGLALLGCFLIFVTFNDLSKLIVL